MRTTSQFSITDDRSDSNGLNAGGAFNYALLDNGSRAERPEATPFYGDAIAQYAYIRT